MPLARRKRTIVRIGFVSLRYAQAFDTARIYWLTSHSVLKPGTYLDHTQREIPLSDFINRELILFSMADNIRSIPSVVDGPGQRKVIWSCFKRNLKKEIKVCRLDNSFISPSAHLYRSLSSSDTFLRFPRTTTAKLV